MCGLLVMLNNESSVRGEVALGKGTLELTKFVVGQDMTRQTMLCFHHTGALATVPAGQVAMLLSNMGFELSTKKDILVTCEIC